MREIKFRVWDKKANQMVCWKDISRTNSLGIFVNNHNRNDSRGILSQYTGLKDKNGVEIYEGDILVEDGHYWEVVFLKGQFTIRYINPVQYRIGAVFSEETLAKYLEGGIWHTLDYGDLKVIGNIYENSELLT